MATDASKAKKTLSGYFDSVSDEQFINDVEKTTPELLIKKVRLEDKKSKSKKEDKNLFLILAISILFLSLIVNYFLYNYVLELISVIDKNNAVPATVIWNK